MINFRKYNVTELTFLSYKIAPLFSMLLTILVLIESLFPSISILLVGNFIDVAGAIFNGVTEYHYLWRSIALLVIFLGISFLFGILENITESRKNIEINNAVRKRNLCFKASLLYRYYENKEQYMLVQCVTEAMAGNIHDAFYCLLRAAGFFIEFFSIAVIFIANDIWQAGIIILLSTLPLSYLSYKNSIYQYKAQKENFSGSTQLYHSTYILKDRATVNERTLFQYTEPINKKWRIMQDKLDEKMLKVNSKIILVRIVTKSINLLIAFVIIFVVLYYSVRHMASVGILIALVSNIITLTTGLAGRFIDLIGRIAKQREFLKDLKEISTYEVSPELIEEPASKAMQFRSIEFRNVSFAYPGTERQIIKNVSFKIERNKKYAFVGKNGSGKTTLIKLLTKLYTEYTGDIFINEINLKNISLGELKSLFGICFQDYSKYELSFRDNIDIGDIENYGNEKDLAGKRSAVIQKMKLEELLQHLPNGEESFLGKLDPDAQDLSGGEWQRISLARVLMKNTDLYILDEPNAALDPKSEFEIYRLFNEISQDKTVILISHRLGTVKDSDQIFVMENGELVEQGTHEKLMELSGTYAEMFNNQSGWYK